MWLMSPRLEEGILRKTGSFVEGKMSAMCSIMKRQGRFVEPRL